MKVEVLVIAGDTGDPVLAYNKVALVLPDETGSQEAHLMDVTSALISAVDEAREAISQQANRLGVALK